MHVYDVLVVSLVSSIGIITKGAVLALFRLFGLSFPSLSFRYVDKVDYTFIALISVSSSRKVVQLMTPKLNTRSILCKLAPHDLYIWTESQHDLLQAKIPGVWNQLRPFGSAHYRIIRVLYYYFLTVSTKALEKYFLGPSWKFQLPRKLSNTFSPKSTAPKNEKMKKSKNFIYTKPDAL